MSYVLEAALSCNIGKIRRNNEDNFFFDGQILNSVSGGLKEPLRMERRLGKEVCLAVFDGMGGESYGELASYAAADLLRSTPPTFQDRHIPKEQYLDRLLRDMNAAVVAKARELGAARMGSTVVLVSFRKKQVYVCNLGDSRAYRLRDGELLQLTADHVMPSEGPVKRKMPLTQHLGIDPEELQIEPFIAEGEIRRGDRYLLCSDGLTDMLSDEEIAEVLGRAERAEDAVRILQDLALYRGGKDNVTILVCRIL